MHDQRTPAERDDVSERAIMDLLIDDPGPWALAELQREFSGHPILVEDAINRLAGVGMVHKLDRFVFASRTAKQASEVFEG